MGSVNVKTLPPAFARRRGDGATLCFHQLSAHGQSHAHALGLSRRPGQSHERLEYLFALLICQSRAAIRHAYRYVTAVVAARTSIGSVFEPYLAAFESRFCSTWSTYASCANTGGRSRVRSTRTSVRG